MGSRLEGRRLLWRVQGRDGWRSGGLWGHSGEDIHMELLRESLCGAEGEGSGLWASGIMERTLYEREH